MLINYIFSQKIISGYVFQVPPSQEVQQSPRGLAGARVAAWGARGTSQWPRGPQACPHLGCGHQPSSPMPSRALSLTPALPGPPHLLQPWERKRRHRMELGALVQSWSLAVTGEAFPAVELENSSQGTQER